MVGNVTPERKLALIANAVRDWRAKTLTTLSAMMAVAFIVDPPAVTEADIAWAEHAAPDVATGTAWDYAGGEAWTAPAEFPGRESEGREE